MNCLALHARRKLSYLVTLLPACFMTAVCLTFICIDKTGFGLPAALTPWLGCGTFLVSLALFFCWHSRRGASPAA